MTAVTIVGAGLAGCEAAWQLVTRGIDVRLLEQKPLARTPAQTTDAFCELVCSNSLRGADPATAVGLLKEELRRAGSLIVACADATRVPAGCAGRRSRALLGRGDGAGCARTRGWSSKRASSRRCRRASPSRPSSSRPARSRATRSRPISRASSGAITSRITTRSRPSWRPSRSTGTRCSSSPATARARRPATTRRTSTARSTRQATTRSWPTSWARRRSSRAASRRPATSRAVCRSRSWPRVGR